MNSWRVGEAGHDTIDLVVNGARLAEADEADLSVLERPLRSLALADSPILLRGAHEDCVYVIDRLHELGRRAHLPLHVCQTIEPAEALLSLGAHEPAHSAQVVGTWALYDVGRWPQARQLDLARALEALDEARLAGRLGHADIPRVLVIIPPFEAEDALVPRLSARLSYFKLRLDRS